MFFHVILINEIQINTSIYKNTNNYNNYYNGSRKPGILIVFDTGKIIMCIIIVLYNYAYIFFEFEIFNTLHSVYLF